jgi:hypothetical protein
MEIEEEEDLKEFLSEDKVKRDSSSSKVIALSKLSSRMIINKIDTDETSLEVEDKSKDSLHLKNLLKGVFPTE